MELSEADLLAWYLDAGVDECIADAPQDRFAQSKVQSQSQAQAQSLANAKAPQPGHQLHAAHISGHTPPDSPRLAPAMEQMAAPMGEVSLKRFFDEGHAQAQNLAANATDLESLKALVNSFDGLPLRLTALNTLFGQGQVNAKVMVISDFPDQEEDVSGQFFAGKQGILLNAMLSAIGLSRDDIYMACFVPWRPVEGRPPSADERKVCLPFLIRHIELVRPQTLLLLGGGTAQTLFKTREMLHRCRGVWHQPQFNGQAIPALASFGPAYLLNTPHAKRDSWADLRMLKTKLDMA